MRKFVLMAVAVFGLACATGVAAKPVPEIPLEDGAPDGVVYVYRLHVNSAAWIPRGVLATLDGKTVANLPFNGCTAFRIPAGHHAVGADWAPSLIFSLNAAYLLQRPGPLDPVPTELAAGERRYYRFSISEKPSGYNKSDIMWQFEEMTPHQARMEMSKCFFVKPKVN